MAGELRFDPLTREWVSIVGHRQARPNLPDTGCPFCVGGVEAPEPYDVRYIKNRWPALPDGRHEVVLHAPEHCASFPALGVPGIFIGSVFQIILMVAVTVGSARPGTCSTHRRTMRPAA